MKIKVATAYAKEKIARGDTDSWRIFNGSFENEDLTLEEFIDKIKNSFAYTAQHGRYRDSEYFECGQVIALDFDTEDFRSTFTYLLENEFIAKYCSFLHTTPRHQQDAPRSRAVFVLDRPIYDKDKFAELATALVEKFKMADASCKDPARFFYGSRDADVCALGNILTLEDAAELLVKPYREYLAEKKRLDAENAKNRVIASAKEVPQSLLDAHSASLIERVVNAEDGNKHYELRRIATTFGGYVTSGYYEYNSVVLWLKNAIRQNTNSVDDLTNADKTIESGVKFGMRRPLYFDSRDNTFIAEEIRPEDVPELDEVHPPLTESQKLQVGQIIEKREWKLYLELRQEKTAEELNISLNNVVLDHLSIGYKPKKIDNDTGEIFSGSALTVPYFTKDGATAIEYRWDNGDFSYEGDVGLYYVRPFFEEETKYGIVVPDSIQSVKGYISGDGLATWYGLPHTNITVKFPDVPLYCFFDDTQHMEQLELLDAFGCRFIRVYSVDDMLNNLNRKEVERIAIRGRRLKEII